MLNSESAHIQRSGLAPWFHFTSAGEIAFALRTTLAGLAALFAAMWLQIDVPRWAIWTVFIISPPVRGNALRKTGARLIGTAIGCTVGVVSVAMFPQDRLGFYLIFSTWLAACAYWATLKRGYVSYAASLAAFTSAIVSAGVASDPVDVWLAAVNRGSATVVGVMFALLASEIAARSDDVPGDFAKRICALAADLLDWGVKQIELGVSQERKDAPFTAAILGLDETCTNAIAERPALSRVKTWIRGLPTALLSLQSAVLNIRTTVSEQDATQASTWPGMRLLRALPTFLRSSEVLDLQSLRRQAASVAALQDASLAQTPALNEIVDALLYFVGGVEAILTMNAPTIVSSIYPRPKFVAHSHDATINFIRAIAGIAVGFIIWNLTAWPQGATFLVNVAIAVVVFVTLDDPVMANRANLISTTAGGVVGLTAKYFLLVRENDPLNLVIVLAPLLFIGAWIQTKGKLAPLGLFFIIGLLVMIEPRNPQHYDFVQDVNVLFAIAFAYAFVSLLFLTIGAPRKGVERIIELLARIRQRRRALRFFSTRQQRLGWETQMYDELQRLQSVTQDPRHRECGVNLLLSGLRTPEMLAPAVPGW